MAWLTEAEYSYRTDVLEGDCIAPRSTSVHAQPERDLAKEIEALREENRELRLGKIEYFFRWLAATHPGVIQVETAFSGENR